MHDLMIRAGLGAMALFVVASLARAQVDENDTIRRITALEVRQKTEIDSLRRDYETRIAGLEEEIRGLHRALDDVGDSVRAPLEKEIEALRQAEPVGGTLGQTTLFSNTRNPAIGLVGEFLFTSSTLPHDRQRYDRFNLRSVELTIVGEVDEMLEYYVALHLDEEEVALEEGYAIARDLLPDPFTLKFGRFNIDHGRTSPFHGHELPFVDKPGVIQEFLEGSLRGTGMELHSFTTLGDAHLLRWSLGAYNKPDGDAEVVAGPLAVDSGYAGYEDDIPGEHDFGDFAFNARVTALFELSETDTIQIGLSALWSPSHRVRLDDDLAPDPAFVRDLQKLTATFDLTWKSMDSSDGSGFVAQAEFLFNHEDSGDSATGIVSDRDAIGVQAWVEYHIDTRLSFGAGVDWFERAYSDDDSLDVGAWATWKWSEYNRLHLEARWYDSTLYGDDFFIVMFQWITTIGNHGHPLPW